MDDCQNDIFKEILVNITIKKYNKKFCLFRNKEKPIFNRNILIQNNTIIKYFFIQVYSINIQKIYTSNLY